MPDDNLISLSDVPCCPEISKDPCCDKRTIRYRLDYDFADMPIELIYEIELERCPGPLALGDVVWSNTLLPGEKVRLVTASRRSRFTYDNESDVSYSHEQKSEETYLMESWTSSVSDLTVTDRSDGTSSSSGEYSDKIDTVSPIAFAFEGADVTVKGSHNSSSSFDLFREISRHAESSSQAGVQGVRTLNSISIGEVSTRFHAEGESESAFEAASRSIENKNQCHAVTYFAYQLEKKQILRLSIKAVLIRVKDPVGVTQVTAKRRLPDTGVGLVAENVLAASDSRAEAENRGRVATLATATSLVSQGGSLAVNALRGAAGLGQGASARQRPISDGDRAQAVAAVRQELQKADILDDAGNPTDRIKAELEFEIHTCLPTTAVVVKGCIDDCNTCEPARQESIKLDLERKALENEMLKKQIEILEQSQEYRCCPADETEDE